MKMEPIESSETSAFRTQTPGNYPKENMLHYPSLLESEDYLLTRWCRILLEQLTGLKLVKKFPAFHGTWMFITALTNVRHLSLSWASPIQSIYPHPTSWRSILILSTHLLLGLPNGLFPSGFPTKTLYTPSPHPYAPHAQPISFFSILFWKSETWRCASDITLKYQPHFLLQQSKSGDWFTYFCPYRRK